MSPAGATAEAGVQAADAVASAELHAELDPAGTRRRELVWQDPLASLEKLFGLTGLEQMQAIHSGEVPPPPIAVTMRMGPAEVSEGRVVFTGHPGEEHYNPIGTVHGGYVSTLLDTVLGCAVQTTLPAGVGYTTQSLEVKMLRPITRDTGVVHAEAWIDYRGRRQATASGRVFIPGSEKLLATGTTTTMLLGGE